jgi:hypothetical protein
MYASSDKTDWLATPQVHVAFLLQVEPLFQGQQSVINKMAENWSHEFHKAHNVLSVVLNLILIF